MVSSRIEQKIEDIYAFVESCKPQALSQSKVVVPKNDLYDLLDDLRRDVPEEITRYQKMLSQRDAILEDAEAKADAIKLDAQEQYKAMVEEHAIMQEAYQQAEETVARANAEAQAIIDTARRQAERRNWQWSYLLYDRYVRDGRKSDRQSMRECSKQFQSTRDSTSRSFGYYSPQ